MATRLKTCAVPGCPNLTTASRCETHAPKPWANTAPRLRGSARRDRNRRVLRRHHGMCHVCGRDGANQVDHVVPLAHGGADDESNLRPIHEVPCHREKTQRESLAGRSRRS